MIKIVLITFQLTFYSIQPYPTSLVSFKFYPTLPYSSTYFLIPFSVETVPTTFVVPSCGASCCVVLLSIIVCVVVVVVVSVVNVVFISQLLSIVVVVIVLCVT
jgi:hypothetical protein